MTKISNQRAAKVNSKWAAKPIKHFGGMLIHLIIALIIIIIIQ